MSFSLSISLLSHLSPTCYLCYARCFLFMELRSSGEGGWRGGSFIDWVRVLILIPTGVTILGGCHFFLIMFASLRYAPLSLSLSLFLSPSRSPSLSLSLFHSPSLSYAFSPLNLSLFCSPSLARSLSRPLSRSSSLSLSSFRSWVGGGGVSFCCSPAFYFSL